jgi:hypothetical protein
LSYTYCCRILSVACNLSYATRRICGCMCRMQLKTSCIRQLQNGKFLHSTIGKCAGEFVVLWEHENVGANFYTNEKFCALWTYVSFYILILTIMLCTWKFDTSLCSISSSKLSFFRLFYCLLFEQIVEATWVSRVTKLHWLSRSWGTRNGINCRVVFIMPKIVCIFCV